MTEQVKQQAAKVWRELLDMQLSRRPVLTNAETPADEARKEAELDAIIAEHGLTEADLEQVAELVL